MPAFSTQSQKQLQTCDPDLQKVFNEVIKHWDCTVLQGHRGEDEQNELYRTGKSQLQYPDSEHNSNPSRAIDVVPYFSNAPHIRWDDKAAFYHFAGFVLGVARQMGIELTWGGNWDGDDELHDSSFIDMPHFQLA